jgi:hypothetical protein
MFNPPIWYSLSIIGGVVAAFASNSPVGVFIGAGIGAAAGLLLEARLRR